MDTLLKFVVLLLITIGISWTVPTWAQTTHRLSDNSGIQISGTSTLSDWAVKSQDVSGEMIFTASSKKAKGKEIQPGVIKNAKAVLEATSIKSEKGEAMDNKMYKALKSDAHPKITFLLTNPVQISKAPAKLSVTGDLDLAGVTHSITFLLDLSYTDNTFHLSGSKALKFSDFEMEPPTAMFGQIVTGNEIEVALDLYFTESK